MLNYLLQVISTGLQLVRANAANTHCNFHGSLVLPTRAG